MLKKNFLKFGHLFPIFKAAKGPAGPRSYGEHLRYWKNMVSMWGVTTSPARPSPNDIEIYKSFLQIHPDIKRVLILGSTPELRDLVAKKTNAKVYLADFSRWMPIAMLRYTRHVNPFKEIWAQKNWLDLPFQNEFFDIILGDLTLQQLEPKFEPIFLEKIKKILKKDGYFISRFHFLDEEFQQKEINSLVTEILESDLKFWEKFNSLKLGISSIFVDMGKRTLNRKVAAEKFEKFLQEKKINNPVLLRVLNWMKYHKNSHRSWSVPAKKDLLKIISRTFSIIDCKNANDYFFAAYHPIFILKKI